MPKAYEPSLNESLLSHITPAPFRDDPVLAPPHPYPGWQSPGGGDHRALLPWIDDDLREHHAEEEHENPVRRGMEAIETAHTAVDLIADGKKTWRELRGPAQELLGEQTSTGAKALAGADIAMSPLDFVGCGMDAADAYSLAQRGEKFRAAGKLAKGAVSCGSGVSKVFGLASAGPLGAVGAGITAAEIGYEIGKHGDARVKQLGWLHDSQGEALSGSEWAGHLGRSADDWLTERGHPHLGTAAGIGTTAAATIAASGMAVAALPVGMVHDLVGVGQDLGTALGRRHRANRYASGPIDNLHGDGARELVAFEDNQEAAIERSKREHPERWDPYMHNPSYGEWFASAAKLAKGGK